MSDYIKREDVLHAIWKTSAEHDLFFPAIILDAIKAIPAADVVERKRGEWVFANSMKGYRCSLCKAQAPFWCMTGTQNLSNYCPNCGAMLEES